jgi:hypothetical protein
MTSDALTAHPPADPPAQPEVVEVEDIESFTPEDVLRFVRHVAAQRDPRRSHRYASMSASQIKDGVDVVLRILAAHRELLNRGARTGKRAHNQRVYQLLAATTPANIVLTEAYLEAAYGILPPSHPKNDH